MKKTKIDRSIDTEALGFQVRESYKTARTNIAYSIFKKGCKKVAFTSSTKGEGKTVTSINVASALAQQVGTKVIVLFSLKWMVKQTDVQEWPRLQKSL